VRILSQALAELLPRNAAVLDIGCGDGLLAQLIMQRRPDAAVSGIDVLLRPQCQIPARAFDGRHVPHEDGAFDVAMLVDVLHHAEDPEVLLAEALRVSRQGILIKDHVSDGFLVVPTLRFMDRVGNAHHGVSLPYNYWSEAKWRAEMDRLGLRASAWRRWLGLYPWPASLFFDRSMHLVSYLVRG
jgi:SAM-dependent methyltransferase